MADGKALQAATSHYLGDGFARTYGVRYTGRSGVEAYPFATSWGITTRLVGALIMTHGDDRGLRLPPAVAPDSVVIVPIYKDDTRARVSEAAVGIAERLRGAGFRVSLDDRDARPGFKFADWELKGTPLRLDIGTRDLDSGTVTLVRRDTLTAEPANLDAIEGTVRRLLDSIQSQLAAEARERRADRSLHPAGLAELEELLSAAAGFATAGWCGSPACETRVKEATAATIRCLPLDAGTPAGSCIVCGRPAAESATWAQAY